MFKIHRSFSLLTGVKNNSICVINRQNKILVCYHDTIVFEFYKKNNASINPTGVITLRTGGYDTVSTRAVINNALEKIGTDWSIVREKGRSFLKDSNGLILPLVDGMELNV